MNEKDVFQAALDISEPDQRAAYVARVCGADAKLRARVTALLIAHDAARQFLNVPIMLQGEFRDAGDELTGEHSRQAGPTDGEGEDGDGAQDESAIRPPDLSFLEKSARADSLGRLEHYEILKVLGQGAFGIVLQAFDEKLQRLVAIKVLNPQLATTSPPCKRFLREARSAAAIKHENVVQVYGVEERPLPYLVMEFVDGQTLQQKLVDSGPIEIAEILHLGQQMAAGLAAAHERGLVHRDIKPGNILLESGVAARAKITDFGLARAADDATMTRTGTIAGTPMYMSPEQAQGRLLDQRTDLFSLGSVLYQMACGRPPFRGANALAVLKRVTDEPPRPLQEILAEVPDWLCAVIGKLHAKQPQDRFQSAREVADVLARCQASWQQHGRVDLPDDVAPFLPRRANATRDEGADTAAGSNRPAARSENLSRRSGRWALAAATLAVLVGVLFLAEVVGVTHMRGSITGRAAPADPLGEAAPPEATGSVSASAPRGDAIPDRSPQFRSGGKWSLVDDEFIQAMPENARILFGDKDWTDYDLEVEAMSTSKQKDGHGIILMFRARDLGNFLDLEVGGWSATVTEAVYFKQGRWGRSPGCFLTIPHEHHRWYKLKVETRGNRIRCWIDGDNLLTYSDDTLLQGMVGLGTGNSPVRWRNLKVTSADGRILWEGFPRFEASVPPANVEPDEAAAR